MTVPKRLDWIRWFLSSDLTSFLSDFSTGAYGQGGVRYKVSCKLEEVFQVNEPYIEHLEAENKLWGLRIKEDGDVIEKLETRITELENWHIQRGGQKVPMPPCPYCDNAKKAYYEKCEQITDKAKKIATLRKALEYVKSNSLDDLIMCTVMKALDDCFGRSDEK